MSSGTEGLYVLANDAVLGWLTAWGASVRAHAPDVRVVVMPYDARTAGVERLAAHFGWTVWADPSLSGLDELVLPASPVPLRAGLQRKLATAWGPLERFVFLDADTLVLTDPSPALAALEATSCSVLFAHCDAGGGVLDEVYRPGPWRDAFVARYGTHAANTGVWAARRGFLTLERIQALAIEAQEVADQFVWPDQSFLNYCLDREGTRVGNLQDATGHTWVWAGEPGCHVEGPALSTPDGRRAAGIHWAGFDLHRNMPYHALWRRWRRLGQPKRRFGGW